MNWIGLAFITGVSLSIPLGVAPHAQPADGDWPNIKIEDVTDKAEIDSRTDQFTEDLSRIGITAKIQSCQFMIRLPVPTARGNISYGGVCKVRFGDKTQTLGICDDNMVGHFAFLTDLTRLSDDIVPTILNRENLAWFTLRNCYGG